MYIYLDVKLYAIFLDSPTILEPHRRKEKHIRPGAPGPTRAANK